MNRHQCNQFLALLTDLPFSIGLGAVDYPFLTTDHAFEGTHFHPEDPHFSIL